MKARTQITGQEIPDIVRSHLDSRYIKSINIGTWNSAGVLRTVEHSSNELATLVASCGVQQKAFFGLVKGDLVQKTSEGTILSNVHSQDATVSILKMNTGESKHKREILLSAMNNLKKNKALNSPYVIFRHFLDVAFPLAKTIINAHTAKHFNGDQINLKYKYYQNTSSDGRNEITNLLRDKSFVLNSSPVRTTQRGLYKLFSHFLNKDKKSSLKKSSWHIFTQSNINKIPGQKLMPNIIIIKNKSTQPCRRSL